MLVNQKTVNHQQEDQDVLTIQAHDKYLRKKIQIVTVMINQ